MTSTRISQHVRAPRSSVYRALLDPRAVATWKVPTGMTCHVHEFDAREGGRLRISLTYDEPTATGKTTAHTDTYHGRFVKLIPNEQVVEVDEFETEDPGLSGEMTIAITLVDAHGGTDVLAVHDGPASRRLAGRQRNGLANGARETRGARRGRVEGARPFAEFLARPRAVQQAAEAAGRGPRPCERPRSTRAVVGSRAAAA